MIYIIGSLRNSKIPEIANKLEAAGIEVFADWFSAGPEADDKWRDYEKDRGRSYFESIYGPSAENVFNFDKKHLDRADGAILVMPAGKSAHLELGYMIGRGKRGYILFDGEPERWDVMVQFATEVFTNLDALIKKLKEDKNETKAQPALFRPGGTIDVSRRVRL